MDEQQEFSPWHEGGGAVEVVVFMSAKYFARWSLTNPGPSLSRSFTDPGVVPKCVSGWAGTFEELDAFCAADLLLIYDLNVDVSALAWSSIASASTLPL
jgi:hypothetical protein